MIEFFPFLMMAIANPTHASDEELSLLPSHFHSEQVTLVEMGYPLQWIKPLITRDGQEVENITKLVIMLPPIAGEYSIYKKEFQRGRGDDSWQRLPETFKVTKDDYYGKMKVNGRDAPLKKRDGPPREGWLEVESVCRITYGAYVVIGTNADGAQRSKMMIFKAPEKRQQAAAKASPSRVTSRKSRSIAPPAGTPMRLSAESLAAYDKKYKPAQGSWSVFSTANTEKSGKGFTDTSGMTIFLSNPLAEGGVIPIILSSEATVAQLYDAVKRAMSTGQGRFTLSFAGEPIVVGTEAEEQTPLADIGIGNEANVYLID